MDIKGITAFLNTWQQLVGSAAGPFIAFILAIWYEARKDRKRSLARIEATLTQVFNEMQVAQEMLKSFALRLDALVQEVKDEANPTTFILSREAFPPLRDIVVTSDLAHLRLGGSYYLHNKLLWIDTGVKNANSAMQMSRISLGSVFEMNEAMVARKVPPPQQRADYAANLQAYTGTIRNLTDFLSKGLRLVAEAKLYNAKFNTVYQRTVGWWYEGVSFKYFKNRREITQYTEPLNVVDRINALLVTEVDIFFAEVENRKKNI